MLLASSPSGWAWAAAASGSPSGLGVTGVRGAERRVSEALRVDLVSVIWMWSFLRLLDGVRRTRDAGLAVGAAGAGGLAALEVLDEQRGLGAAGLVAAGPDGHGGCRPRGANTTTSRRRTWTPRSSARWPWPSRSRWGRGSGGTEAFLESTPMVSSLARWPGQWGRGRLGLPLVCSPVERLVSWSAAATGSREDGARQRGGGGFGRWSRLVLVKTSGAGHRRERENLEKSAAAKQRRASQQRRARHGRQECMQQAGRTGLHCTGRMPTHRSAAPSGGPNNGRKAVGGGRASQRSQRAQTRAGR